jgi:hypothetical protein
MGGWGRCVLISNGRVRCGDLRALLKIDFGKLPKMMHMSFPILQ